MKLDSKIAVVCGGVSTEREISLLSGKSCYNALLKKGYKNAYLFDLTKDNIADLLSAKPDIAFLALHGKGGEDGCIQGVLELAGIPYTGPGVAASAICMNKIMTKRVLVNAGIPTAKFSAHNSHDYPDLKVLADELLENIQLPMVLKSPCQGSSIGVVIVKKEEDIIPAIQEVFKYGEYLLAEQFLDGMELTLPILGNYDVIPLPLIEITSERDFYDYKAKYTSGLCHHIIPARIDEATRQKVVEIGIQAYRTLNCCGLSRVDLILDKQNGPMVIEVNTLPGMTDMSLFPDAARSAGMSYEELVEKILDLGFITKRTI